VDVRPVVALTEVDREGISRGLAQGLTARQIGREIGRHHSVVCSEIVRNGGGREAYRAAAAQQRAVTLRARPKERKLVVSRALHDEVNRGLAQSWSPAQISRRLRREHPGVEELQVSPETVYQCLYLQARGELRTQLKLTLRQGRTRRVAHERTARPKGQILDMVNISERPKEAEDRAVPGFWEGDLIIGKGGKSQIATLVERRTRYTMLLRVPYDRTAERVSILLAAKMKTLPKVMQNSVTWDQGKELARHAAFTMATGMPVYFCDPHSPWQRGTNENTNGLLRQYFPKGTDLSLHSQAELDRVAEELNGRPRETLDFRTPTEVFTELVQADLSR
jgi:IS30 family transposase